MRNHSKTVRWPLVLALAALLGGCFTSSATRCGDGRVCPATTRCDVENHRCVGALEEEACFDRGEDAPCNLIGAPGRCKVGICKPFFCGDGVINGAEECDGDNLGGADCRKRGYYAVAGLKCLPSCKLDEAACTGRCGDGIVDGTETCDGAPPEGKSCLDYGFDRGLLACSSLCGPALEGCRAFGWTPILSPMKQPLRDMWASGPDDVFAIDASGASVLHWDGARWSTMETGVTEPTVFAALWGSAPDDLYVVGQSKGTVGIMMRWNGRAWLRVGPNLAVPDGIFMPGGAYLADVWGTGPNDVFAVGGQIDGLAIHWDGTSWSTNRFLGNAPFPHLGRLWGSGPKDVFAVGGSGIVHWDGTAWTHRRPEMVWPYLDIAGSGPDDVLAVGSTVDGSMIGTGLAHFDGTAWSPLSLGSIVSPAGIWAGEVHDVFLLGVKTSAGDESSVTFRWNGKSWDKVRVKAPGPLTFGATFPGGVFASGDDGTIVRWDYTNWSADGVMANGIWSNGPNDAISVGAGGLFRWDGTGWFAMATAAPLVQTMAAVWAAAPTDSWAVGDGGTIVHWDGVRWSTKVAGIPSVSLRAVWGSGPNDVYVVGDGGTIVRWNGQAWSAVAAGTSQDLSGVWGSGANDVYVVGRAQSGDSAILHFDGAGWTAVFTGPTPLRSVWGSGRSDVYVGGDAGTIVHWDGASWKRMVSRSTQPIFGIGGSSASDVFAVADKTLLHLRDQTWEAISLPSANQLRGLSVTPSRVFIVGTLPENHLDRSVSCAGPERTCDDGWDNDCDGAADAADPDCAGKVTEVCANLADDDHDGLVDCADADCAEFPSCKAR